ncbi:MAG: pyruvate synthase [Candidatus Brocadia sp.]|nr:MAG: pyruvate synthase [Candidatus Brocadia sp.]
MEVVGKGSSVIDVPFEPALVSIPTIYITENTPRRKTGNCRVFKPVWNYEACTKCMTCVARCPDGCIVVNEDSLPCAVTTSPLICVEECPVKAIVKAWEVSVG